jgi:hypothetical protein
MASITLENLFDSLNKTVEDITSKDQLEDIGKAIAEIIKVRTRLGYGVSRQGGKREELNSLSKKYTRYRRKNRRLLSSSTRPNKSNLTFTGQMLDSITFKAGRGKLRVEPSGRRRDGLTNLKLAEHVTDKGRPFFLLSDNELKQIVRIFDFGLNQSLKRRLGR